MPWNLAEAVHKVFQGIGALTASDIIEPWH